MTVQAPRTRTLILGCDYPTFHLYWRYYSQVQDLEICGFVYCEDGEPPISKFKGTYKVAHSVYKLCNLKTIIKNKGIQNCVIQVQNMPNLKVQSIINTILSTGSCGFEFIPSKSLIVRSFKPIISVTSIAKQVGKSQLARYFCTVLSSEGRRVAVIYPLPVIKKQEVEELNIFSSPHYEFNQTDPIPSGLFTQDDELQIKKFQESGAYRIFATADTRQAIICAEQCADVIIFDSHLCETPYIDAKARYCVVSVDALADVRNRTEWPGIANAMESEKMVIISHGELSKSIREQIKDVFNEQSVLFARSHNVIDGSSGTEIFDKNVLVIDEKEHYGTSKEIAMKMGARKLVIPKQVSKGLETREGSIVANIKPSTELSTAVITAINQSDADVVIASLNNRHLIEKNSPKIDRTKTILYTSAEISDHKGMLYESLAPFLKKGAVPTLKNHFESQVDIIMALAKASDKELSVTNNDSANREAFCRLFLRSHLPPGYRVTTGEIIDCNSTLTGQLDVIIVNDVCPRMTIDTTDSIIAPVLADSVLGVIEVKTTLTQEALKKALSQMRPVKSLMPSHTTLQMPDGSGIKRDPLEGKIITGIFSFNPVSEVEDKIPEILERFPNVVDFIVIPSAYGFFSTRTLTVCGIKFENIKTYNGYAKIKAKGMGLALIFGILNSLAAIRRFSGVNSARYLFGNWGGNHDRFSNNLQSFKTKLGAYDKLIVNLKPESKEEYFKLKGEMVNSYDQIYNKNPTQPK